MGAPGGLETGRGTHTDGTAAAVTAVLTPLEGRSHAEGQHLELVVAEGERGDARTSSRIPIRWMA